MTEQINSEVSAVERQALDEFSVMVNESINKLNDAAREIIKQHGTPLNVIALAMGICAVDAAAAIAVEENVSIESMMDFIGENMRSRVDVSMSFYRDGLEKMRQAESEVTNA